MHTLDIADRIAASAYLYRLADRIRQERDQWTSLTLRAELSEASLRVADAAALALHTDPIRSDAYALEVERELQQIIGARKFIERLA